MSLQWKSASADRSATSRSPSGSRRRSLRSCIDTTSSRPSGSQPSPDGHASTPTTRSARPSRPTRRTTFACMSENQSFPSCQRGPSGKHRPSSRSFGFGVSRVMVRSYQLASLGCASLRATLRVACGRRRGRPRTAPVPSSGSNSYSQVPSAPAAQASGQVGHVGPARLPASARRTPRSMPPIASPSPSRSKIAQGRVPSVPQVSAVRLRPSEARICARSIPPTLMPAPLKSASHALP